MGNMRIGSRLLLGFGIIVLLSLLLGAYALQKHADLQALTEGIDSRDFATLQNVQEILRGEDQMRSTREAALLAGFFRKEKIATDPPEVREREWRQAREKNLKMLNDLDQRTSQLQAAAVTARRAEGWRR